ncbi:hypothetical protein Salat_0862900, partial [Sesamum alatum]
QLDGKEGFDGELTLQIDTFFKPSFTGVRVSTDDFVESAEKPIVVRRRTNGNLHCFFKPLSSIAALLSNLLDDLTQLNRPPSATANNPSFSPQTTRTAPQMMTGNIVMRDPELNNDPPPEY